MKLGVMIEAQEGIGWEQWCNVVRWTEDFGFESLWRSDHFFSLVGTRNLDALETFVSLTYAAGQTERIRFGPLVCSMTFRHPAIVARMAAAIDRLSVGRFVLGLGAGWNVPEHNAFGIPLPSPRPRIEALEEGVAVIRLLLNQERASFNGKYFRLVDAEVNPKSARSPIPILIGGGGERYTLAVVARCADEWNVPGLPIEQYRRKVATLEVHCEREGRDPESIARSIVYTHVIGESEEEAQRLAEELAVRMAPEFRPGAAIGPDSSAWLIGTPSRIVEQIKALEYEGVSRVMLQYREPPTRQQLELVAREVLPHV